MSKGVTFLRHAGKSISDEYLAKVLDENKTSASFAVATTDGSKIVVRKHVGSFTLDEAKKFIGHESLKTRTIAVHFGNDVNTTVANDVQPFTILEGPVVDEKSGAPRLIVAFLDGDFSEFAQAGVAKSPEQICVEKRVIPIVVKAFKYSKGDLHDTFIELKDDLNAETFANLMIGDTGCITLMGANGDLQHFLVNGETASGEIEGGWSTNNFQTTTESEPADDLEKELEGKPAEAPAAPPTKRPGHGLPGSKPTVPSVAPADNKPDVRPAEGGTPGLPDMGDPESRLTINIPSGMENDLKRKATWMRKRMPEGMLPKEIKGLTKITVRRKDASGAFLQTYVEQNKLSGLKDALSGSTAIQAPKRSGGLPPATKSADETKHPDSGTPVPSPQEDGDSPVIPGLVEGPLPIFTPTQVTETINFKDAVDKKGYPIVSPEDMEKKLGTFMKMFGDKFKIGDTRNWPLEERVAYAKHSPDMIAKLWYWLDHEIAQAYAMLDKLVEPHHSKAQEPEAAPQQQRKVAGGGLPPRRNK